MQTIVEKHINENLPFLKGKKLLVAISGGIDSVVLTHILQKLDYNISLAHCNFSLRGKESNKDEVFVKELGDKLEIPTHTIKFDTDKYALENGISTQMAARDLRYNWFQKIKDNYSLDYIITAHHKDDIIETFLINLTRGTGLNGLTGIPEINGDIIRPFLPFDRNDILIHATKNKLKWREDESNSSIKYVRNKIRHKVVPFLKEINPNLLDTLNSTLENLRGSQEIINDSISKIREKVVITKNNQLHFNIAKLKELNNPKIYLYELLNAYNFTNWKDVTNLLDAQTGKQVYSNTHKLLKDRDVLILSELVIDQIANYFEIPEFTSKIKIPIKLKFETVDIPFDTKNHSTKIFSELILNDSNTISIDYDKLKFPLTLKKWEKGDFFYPIGLNGKKKLSKFFKDEKLSLLEKESAWLLCSNNEIVWVIGKRLDERFKVTKTTCKLLKIKF
ncbi:tRNA lysidine(34) synthetase TilS [Lutibacter citreus]|uniref:tRNA lysidine(34) synthetase TilS n=1 Tax=Lutibacter citreus TaxID=2138210 RepID=UPI000DBE5C6F|nr:tRNA lysidine(34) synthetase TilS [Lutibacter citreus]